jgi:hypothetical protein
MGEAVVKKDHEEKDLGVLFSTDLKFSRHIAAAANKGNRVVGAIRRSFRSMDKQMFMQLYKSLVRGHLEYANTVWAPIKLADVDHLEKVQRRATKLVPEIRNMTYPQRLRELKLPSLVYRRARGDMIETYKLLHGLVDSPQHMPLQLDERGYTRGHCLKLKKRFCRTAIRQHVFSQRVVNPWNGLPEAVVMAPSLNAFKNRLDKHWANHPKLYHHRD